MKRRRPGGEARHLRHRNGATARRPYMSVVCGAKRDSVRLRKYDHTRRPYVGPGMLAARITGRRAELVFLRSTWPRGSSQPTDVASEMTTPTAATLVDSPSPDVAVAATDSATDDIVTENRGVGTAG